MGLKETNWDKMGLEKRANYMKKQAYQSKTRKNSPKSPKSPIKKLKLL